MLGLWSRRSLRIAAPLVDLRLLRHRGVSSLTLSTALLGVATYQVTRYVGYSIGSGMAVSLLYIFGSSELPEAGAFAPAFACAAVFGILSAVVAWRFDRDDEPTADPRAAARHLPSGDAPDDGRARSVPPVIGPA